MTEETPSVTGRERPPTMKAIARAAGVGLGTVSRALSVDGHDVAPETRARVLEAARELRYRPSALGRGLKQQRTDTIGLLVADISNPFYGEFAQGVLASARAANRHVIVGSSGEDAASELEYIDLMLEQRVDGIIAFPTGANVESWTAARALGVAVVFADRTIDGLPFASVVADNFAGMKRLTEHLLEGGHRSIGYIGGPVEVSSGRLREEGYLEAMRSAGVTEADRLVVREGFTRDAAHASTLRLLDDHRPTALIASNNVLGEAALAALRDRDLRFPDDISLAMFDDVPWASLTRPAITVQAQPARELGRRAVASLLDDSGGVDEIVVATELVVRDSTRPLG
jgi:LacI family transcriptional regulator